MSPRVYLAGPEVFLRDPVALYDAKKRICARHGFEGVSPLDHLLDVSQLAPPEAGYQIGQANERHMRVCELAIANMTPFRSPSADVGTAYEMGFMRALGKPVLAYTNSSGSLLKRTVQCLAGGVQVRDEENALEDADGMLIENFELRDNLMLAGAVRASGFLVIPTRASRSRRYTDLRGFERCLELAASLGYGRPRAENRRVASVG